MPLTTTTATNFNVTTFSPCSEVAPFLYSYRIDNIKPKASQPVRTKQNTIEYKNS